MTHNSITTPKTTSEVKTYTQYSQGNEFSNAAMSLSRADMALSRAEMELSKAETRVGTPEAAWAKGAIITMALLLIPIG